MEAKPEAFLMLKALPSFLEAYRRKQKSPLVRRGFLFFHPQAASSALSGDA